MKKLFILKILILFILNINTKDFFILKYGVNAIPLINSKKSFEEILNSNQNKLIIIVAFLENNFNTYLMVDTYQELYKRIKINKDIIVIRTYTNGTISPLILTEICPSLLIIYNNNIIGEMSGIKTFDKLLNFVRNIYKERISYLTEF